MSVDEFRCGNCWELKKTSCMSGKLNAGGKPICVRCVARFAERVARQKWAAASTARTTQRLKDNPGEYLNRIMKRSRKGEE